MVIKKYWITPAQKQKRIYMTKKRKIAKMRKKNLNIVILIFVVFIAGYLTEKNNRINPEFVSSFEVARSTVITRSTEDDILSSVDEVEKTNEMQIREIAKEFNFRWEDYLVNLACCEGLLKTETINDKGNYPSYSIDRGLYGINNYWHAEVSDEVAFDLRASTIWTMNHINNGKQHEFTCNKRIKGVNNFYKRCLINNINI